VTDSFFRKIDRLSGHNDTSHLLAGPPLALPKCMIIPPSRTSVMNVALWWNSKSLLQRLCAIPLSVA
jgi:hypothetical protein